LLVPNTRDHGPNEGSLDHILYVVVLPSDGSGEFTPFQGFSFNTLEAIEPLFRICSLPATIEEVFISRREAIARRATGLSGYAIALLDREFVPKFDAGLPFTCFISTPSTASEVEGQVQSAGRGRWLHLTLEPNAPDIISLRDFSRRRMYTWARGLARTIAEEGHLDISQGKLKVRPFARWKKVTTTLRGRRHNITAPSETALSSVAFSLSKADPIIGATDDVFVKALTDAAHEVERVRSWAIPQSRAFVPGTPSLIVAVPSVFRRLTPRMTPSDASKPVRRAFRSVLRQQQYTAMQSEVNEAKDFLDDPAAKHVLGLRAMELKAYTAALCTSAASLCAPVLRCPPQVDRIRELLVRLDGLARGGRVSDLRLHTVARGIGQSLRASIPRLLLDRMENHLDNGIKLVGDTPLELLPIGDLPLSLRVTTSRMPTLPGNLMMRHCLMRTTTLLKPRELRRVLIVRSFEDDDPLREMLTTSVRQFYDDSAPIECIVADVRTVDEFVSAFNRFDGAIAVFDGHGSHSRSARQGSLRLGPLSLDPFELYGKIRVPPIILLSACETHPLDGVESSVASAFLFMGAQSVLGTTLPVSGPRAAILVGRFMHRFSGLLPLITRLMPWSQVVADMLRMSYVTDVLRALAKHYPITKDIHLRVHTEANLWINTFRPDWFDRFLVSLANAVDVTEPDIRETWLRIAYFTDTLRYVHLGQPEHMFVVPQALADESERQKA
jgi:hypothetical protein